MIKTAYRMVPLEFYGIDIAGIGKRLHEIRDRGFETIELTPARPSVVDAISLRSQLEQAGLKTAALNSDAVLTVDGISLLADTREKSREAMERLAGLIDLAEALGTPLVSVGRIRGWLAKAGGDRARWLLFDLLTIVAKRAKTAGVRLAIEPLDQSTSDWIHTVSQGLDILDQLRRPEVGLVLDTLQLQREERDPQAAVQLALQSGKLWHVHSNGPVGGLPGADDPFLPVLLQDLQAGGYMGVVSSERFSN